jgi:hypothetical protein
MEQVNNAPPRVGDDVDPECVAIQGRRQGGSVRASYHRGDCRWRSHAYRKDTDEAALTAKVGVVGIIFVARSWGSTTRSGHGLHAACVAMPDDTFTTSLRPGRLGSRCPWPPGRTHPPAEQAGALVPQPRRPARPTDTRSFYSDWTPRSETSDGRSVRTIQPAPV